MRDNNSGDYTVTPFFPEKAFREKRDKIQIQIRGHSFKFLSGKALFVSATVIDWKRAGAPLFGELRDGDIIIIISKREMQTTCLLHFWSGIPE